MKLSWESLLLANTVLSSIAFAAGVDQREANQEARLSQGIRSGQLAERETAHLEGRETHLSNEIARDLAANGGHLTAAERSKVNRQ